MKAIYNVERLVLAKVFETLALVAIRIRPKTVGPSECEMISKRVTRMLERTSRFERYNKETMTTQPGVFCCRTVSPPSIKIRHYQQPTRYSFAAEVLIGKGFWLGLQQGHCLGFKT